MIRLPSVLRDEAFFVEPSEVVRISKGEHSGNESGLRFACDQATRNRLLEGLVDYVEVTFVRGEQQVTIWVAGTADGVATLLGLP